MLWHESLFTLTNKKILAIFWLLVFVATLFFIGPLKSSAQLFGACNKITVPPVPQGPVVPVYDSNVARSTANINRSTTNQENKECLFDGWAKFAARSVINQLTTSLIQWIRTGFEGSPTFIQDPVGFFGNIADEELGRLLDSSELGFLCDPFLLQIKFGLWARSNRYKYPSRCTITGAVNNIANFTSGTAGSFKDGGWDGWFRMVNTPQNNPYGGYIYANELYNIRVAGRQNSVLNKLNWGNGFHSLEKCTRYVDTDDNPSTPDECAQFEIQTPGSLVNDQLQQWTGQDLEYLNLAKEFDDIVLALVELGVSQVMQNGVAR
ncbi:MAG TPA: hypothetical protein VI981_03650 [Candidatus Paceibacterota bacterium]